DFQKELAKTGDFGLAAGIIIERELGKMGDVALTSADKIAQVNAKVDNIKVKVGNELAAAFSELETTISDIKKLLDKDIDEGTVGGAIGWFFSNVSFRIPRTIIQFLDKQLEFFNKLLNGGKQPLKETTDELKSGRAELDKWMSTYSEITYEVAEIKSQIEALVLENEEGNLSLEAYHKNLRDIERLEKILAG